MRWHQTWILCACLILSAGLVASADVKTVVDRNQGDDATAQFKFKHVPSPSKTDAAQKAKFEIVEGEQDSNGGDLDKLHDGQVPTEEDQPEANFFFAQNTDGGRILIDLQKTIDIKEINTYSWHPNTRGPQVYKLYASDGKASNFDSKPKRDADMQKAGWKLITSVDTRPKEGEVGGQFGVSITDSDGSLGKYRYLLLDANKTESEDPFGNTFYSEIDVIDRDAPAATAAPTSEKLTKTLTFGGKYQCVIDYTQAPEFKDWIDTKLSPVVEEWYPRLVEMLPSEGYHAPTKFSIVFHAKGRGVAATGGTRITADVPWFSKNLNGQAVGALVHEMVHVVQQYGVARDNNPRAQVPGWFVEAMADYLRWFLYEPQSHGADHIRNVNNVRYNSPYRTGANFLDYVTRKYDKQVVPQINAAIRNGTYNQDIWKKLTGKTADELGDEWKAALKANNGYAFPKNEAGQ